MESINKCDLCGTPVEGSTVIWDKTKREKMGILQSVVIRDAEGNIIHDRNVICKNCGLVYVEPKMSREELKRFYENDYRKTYGGDLSIESEKQHAKTTVQILKDTFKSIRKGGLLDVGCSTGELISRVNGIGIEPNVEHYGKARSKSLNVANADIESYSPGVKFDIITMLNALEHVYSPTEVLKKINSLLVDDGYLLVSVPDLYGRHVRQPVDVFLSNAHLYAFVIPTITAYFNKCGFKVLRIYSTIESIGSKLYVLGQKTEQEFQIPEFGEAEMAAIPKHLAAWDFVYQLKEKIKELGYR